MEPLLTYPRFDPDTAARLSDELACHPVIAGLLVRRGITTHHQARAFLDPDLSGLSDPFTLKDMEKAVERIYTAVLNHEKILIFGDFDADGITATALLLDFLSQVDADLTWYIPHRVKEGYGMNPDHAAMAADMDVDLIITVDCGISSIDAVNAAAREDIDVIVTDHHEPGQELPKALALIDPKQKDCPSGLAYLAGVGVALYLAMALRKFFRENGVWETLGEPSLAPLLDLFAMGTIGDMVPLIRENRQLCAAGIRQMRKNLRPGLAALLRAARLDAGRLDSDDVSFKIVPRLNAAGRISHARICVSLLTCKHHAEAEQTAMLLDELNRKRQAVEKQIVLDIENRIFKDPSLISERLLFLHDPEWNPGVLGIAASKLARKHACPVVLLSCVDDLLVGSCRSINQINIYNALAENAHLLEKFGGHALASGLTLTEKRLAELCERLCEHFNTHYTHKDFQKRLAIDAELEFNDMDLSLAKQIDLFRPFGTSNPEPVFLCRNLKVVSSHILGGRHRRMVLKDAASQDNSPSIEAFHFNVGHINDLPDFYSFLAFRLKLNKFRPDSIQLIVEDLNS